jgi:hypothetical protein
VAVSDQPPVDGRCDECGYDYDAGELPDVLDTLNRQAGECGIAVAGADSEAVRRKPHPDIWSALEYGCHVRDVLEIQRQRIAQTLVEDHPAYTPMNRDKRAEQYFDQDPAVVAAALLRNARGFTEAARVLDEQQLQRTGVYNYPTPQDRTLNWLVRHTAHEVQHHLFDVRRALNG